MMHISELDDMPNRDKVDSCRGKYVIRPQNHRRAHRFLGTLMHCVAALPQSAIRPIY